MSGIIRALREPGTTEEGFCAGIAVGFGVTSLVAKSAPGYMTLLGLVAVAFGIAGLALFIRRAMR